MNSKRIRPENSAPNKAMEFKDRIVQGLMSADDKVQSFVRTKALGLKDDGTVLGEGEKLGTLREILGGTMFAQRPGGPTNTEYRFQEGPAGTAAAVGMRALQAGVVTAAGAGIMELTAQANAALGDRQENGQLPMY